MRHDRPPPHSSCASMHILRAFIPQVTLFLPVASQKLAIQYIQRRSAYRVRALSMSTTDGFIDGDKSVQDLRVHYSKSGVDETAFSTDPFTQFDLWFSEARTTEQKLGHEVNAMTLATADASGRPSARVVLLKGYDARGFVWYTNYDSRKGMQLAENPYAALVFWWASLERSVRIEGVAARVPPEESDAYFAVRPPESRLGALASDQSRPVESLQDFSARWAKLNEEHLGSDGTMKKEIERPLHWGGFRLVPDRIEFWKGRPARMHDRIEYSRNDLQENEWVMRRLQP